MNNKKVTSNPNLDEIKEVLTPVAVGMKNGEVETIEFDNGLILSKYYATLLADRG